MNKTAAFIMPVKLGGSEMELRHFKSAVESIKRQTDGNCILIMVDDFSDNPAVYQTIDEIKTDLGDKVHVIYSDKNHGAAAARNTGIHYADSIGAPFILFNDTDDVSDPRRLELVRKAFESDSTVNVVYTSFDVIDENDRVVTEEEICLSVRDIIIGHRKDIVEGENAWIDIATKKNYTTLTSCTAVKTPLAVEELFPSGKPVSEDCHTWLRYGAHPGKFVFINEIKNHYRICSSAESRSRGQNTDFYLQKTAVDSDGFEQAMKISKSFGRIKQEDENPIRVAFYVREALSMLYGDAADCAGDLLQRAAEISKDRTLQCIDSLDCKAEYKAKLKALTA